jgi:predicted permease
VMSEWWSKLVVTFRRRRISGDLREEAEAHLQMEVEANIERGLTQEAALLKARVEFGNRSIIEEAARQAWTFHWLEMLWQDIRYGVRLLRRSPGFTAVAVLTLALGVGANAAIFSLVKTVLLNALPFAESDQLVGIWEDLTKLPGPAKVELSPATFLSWRAQNEQMDRPIFEGIAAIDSFANYNLNGRGNPEVVSGAAVSGNLFQLLRLPATIGRTLLPADDGPEAERAVVLSEAFWRQRFGADAGLIGETLTLNGIPYRVVGVVRGDFQYPKAGTKLWVPLALSSEARSQRFNFSLNVIARLRPGVSLENARTVMAGFAANLRRQFPQADKTGVTLAPLREEYTGAVRSTLALLLGTVSIVLLIACANVSQLLLARGTGRRHEVALRGAMGAERGRLVRQLLTESLVLAVLSAVAGGGVAASTFQFLARLIPARFPPGTTLSMDMPVLLFTAAIAGFVALAFGIGPALVTSRLDLDAVLRQGGRGTTGGGRGLRGILVATEVALTVVLLVAAALLLRSYAKLRAVDTGFVSQNLLIAQTDLSPGKYAEFKQRERFLSLVLERTQQIPGVVSAGYSNFAPLVFKGGKAALWIEGRPDPVPGQLPQQIAVDRMVSAGYLSTLGVPLIAGRFFDSRDTPNSVPVAIVNQRMTTLFWPGDDPIGHRIRLGATGNQWFTIVGIAGDVHQFGLDVPPEPEVFLSTEQWQINVPFLWPRNLLVRTQGDPTQLATALRQAVWSVDPEQPVTNIRTMNAVVDAEFTTRNVQLGLIGTFALLALILAAVGLYGVLSYTVAQLTPEIGLRMALGAQRSTLIGMVLRRTLFWTAVGLVTGLSAALGLARFIESFLFGISSTDPLTIAVVVVVMTSVAMVASLIPALHACSIDPTEALRCG